MYVKIALERTENHDPNSSMSMARIAGQVTSLIIAFNLFSIFPMDFLLICIVNCIISAVITSQFYSAQKNNITILGIFTGSIAGILGTAIGYVSLNPEICGLPGISSDLQSITIIIGTFLIILHCAIAMQVNLHVK